MTESWAGLRPGRKEKIRVEIETQVTRYSVPVIHNYGHSGNGWTLHWGCAGDVVAMVQKLLPPSKL